MTTKQLGAAVDPSVGGSYRVIMRKIPDGEPLSVGGTYVEVAEPTRLVLTWQWSTAEMDPSEKLVTVALQETKGTTELTLTHERFSDAELREQTVGARLV